MFLPKTKGEHVKFWNKPVNKNNLLIYLILGFTMLVTQPTSQFFTIYQRDLGFDLTFVGIIAAAAAIFDMLSRFSAGVLSDRKGRKKPLLFLVMGSFLYPFLLIFFKSPASLLLIQILHAIIMAAFWTIFIAYLYDTNSREKGGRVYSRALMALFVVNLIAPFIGGAIIQSRGYHWLFSLSCYVATIPLILVFFLKKPEVHRQKLSIKGEVSDILEKPRFLKVWTVMLLVAFTSSFISTFFPIYLKEQVGLTYQQVGLFFSAGTVILLAVQPFLGWIADRFKSKFVIPINLFVMSAGLFLLSFVSGIWLIFFSKALVPLGIFGSRIKGAANIAKLTPNEEHALAQAMFKSSSGIGWAIMNTISPVLIAAIGYTGVFKALGVVGAFAGVWYFFAYGKKEKAEKEGFLEHIKHHHAFTFSDTKILEQYKHK